MSRELSIQLTDVILRRLGRTVLDDVSLCATGGELVVITGGRGAGQSELLAVAAAVMRPGSGEVRLGGRDLLALQDGSLPYLRRNIGYLEAEPRFLRDESALENVAVALGLRGRPPRAATEQAERTLESLGLDVLAGRRVDRLSPAERRLLGVARALAGHPPLVVLDDPSASLDARDRVRLADRLGEASAAGSAVLCGSSDPLLVELLAARGARLEEMAAGRLISAFGNRDDGENQDDQPNSQDDRASRGGRDAQGTSSGAVVLPFPSRSAREAS